MPGHLEDETHRRHRHGVGYASRRRCGGKLEPPHCREIRDRDGLHGKRRVAFVVDDDVSYGVLRMAVGHSVLAQFELRVVRDQDEAKEWIGLSTDYVLPADR